MARFRVRAQPWGDRGAHGAQNGFLTVSEPRREDEAEAGLDQAATVSSTGPSTVSSDRLMAVTVVVEAR